MVFRAVKTSFGVAGDRKSRERASAVRVKKIDAQRRSSTTQSRLYGEKIVRSPIVQGSRYNFVRSVDLMLETESLGRASRGMRI